MKWDKDDFKMLKTLLDDLIPLIRFEAIDSKDFYEKIVPFEKLFDEKVYKEILESYRAREGKLLNLQMKYLIASWIDHKHDLYNISSLPYDFELVLSGIQDGFSRLVFEEKCYNMEQTIVIMKLKDTGELIGGYNPVCWNIKGRSLDLEYRIKTDKSFIFKIDGQIDNSILSRVKDPEHAICYDDQTINITIDDKRLQEIISFNDIDLYVSTNGTPYCSYFYHYYKDDLDLKDYKDIYLLEEYEVYKLIKKIG